MRRNMSKNSWKNSRIMKLAKIWKKNKGKNQHKEKQKVGDKTGSSSKNGGGFVKNQRKKLIKGIKALLVWL